MQTTIRILLLVLAAFQAEAFSFFVSDPCDTLYTKSGQKFIVHVIGENYRHLQFVLCDDTTHTEYEINWKETLAFQKAGMGPNPLLKDKTGLIPSIPDPKYSKLRLDTCDLIVFLDGQELQVKILETDMYNYFYRMCDPLDDRVLIAPRRQVSYVRRAKKNGDKEKAALARKEKDARLDQTLGCILFVIIGGGVLFFITVLSI
jgi:hypothetical protein